LLPPKVWDPEARLIRYLLDLEPMTTYRTIATLALTSILFAVPSWAAEYLRCESDDGRRVYCDVRGADEDDIEFHRQLSKTRCVEGDNWGIDRRGVWVDDGCRAEFRVDSRSRYGYDRDRHDDRRHGNRERDELERERVELERQRLELERQRQQQTAVQREQCPPGFRPSENKCSSEERRRGCKDIRLPNGLGCVKR
jgi:hypothetical protein